MKPIHLIALTLGIGGLIVWVASQGRGPGAAFTRETFFADFKRGFSRVTGLDIFGFRAGDPSGPTPASTVSGPSGPPIVVLPDLDRVLAS